MIPILVILALIGVMFTAIWYYRTLCRKNHNRTIAAGFTASVSQWLLFLSIGCSPIRSLLYTSFIFLVMILMWIMAEWAQSAAKQKDTGWVPSNAFWVYFLGSIVSSLIFGQALI